MHRINVVRCFKCLEHGHKSRECTAQVDRSDECIKCGEKGHKSRGCQNKVRCVKCAVDGHRADQIKCPHFKKIVEELRRQRIELGGTNSRQGKKDHAP
ncbi:Zinc knuckle [Popillia japonica]|uniref:Zinc knuckle n=1 Tax=Popillia japonica TaxID=7064 RepID=A0AAW1LVL2_POPJA